MDDVPVEDIKRFEHEMITALREMPSEALKVIKETGALDDDTADKLKEEISSFKDRLWQGEEAPDSPAALAKEAEEAGDEEAAEALSSGSEQEQAAAQ
jgi:ATP synthase alpha/beta chain, C terminal domain